MSYTFLPLSSATWPTVATVLGLRPTLDTRGIMARNNKTGEIDAVVVFQNFTHSSAQVHQMIENPMVLRHGFFTEVVEYIYNTAGLKVMIGLVPSDNERALRFNEKLGFSETHRIKDGFNEGVDMVVMEARREDLARWFLKEVA